MSDEARRRAEEIDAIAAMLDSAGSDFLDWKGQLYETARRVHEYVADAIAQAVRELDNWDGELERLRAIRDQQAEEIARLRAALEQYANQANYDGNPSAIDMDDGMIAREALKRL
jgi:chromosome segregation ATPase